MRSCVCAQCRGVYCQASSPISGCACSPWTKQKMEAFDTVMAKRSSCKHSVESANELPAGMQKTTFSCRPATTAFDCPLTSFEQAKSSRNQYEQLKKAIDGPAGSRHQISAVNTTMLLRRQSAATAQEAEPNTSDKTHPQISTRHAGKGVYQVVKDVSAGRATVTSEACPESRPRRREHLKKVPTLPSQTDITTAAVNASCNSKPVCCELPHEKAKEVTSPASTTSDEAHVFASQGKSTVHTQCGSSPHMLQLSQSSTSATPPPSECSSDESPYSFPQVCEETTFQRSCPFEPAGAASATSLTEAEVATPDKPQNSVYVTVERSTAGEDFVMRGGFECTTSNSNNAGTSPASNWLFTPEKSTQDSKRGAVQGRKQKKHNAHKERSTSGDCAKVDKNHNRRNRNNQGAAGHYNELSGKRLTAATVPKFSACSGISQRSGGHDSTHRRPLHEIRQTTQAPPPPPPPPPPPSSPSLTISAESSAFAAAALSMGSRTDAEDTSSAVSVWRCLSPERPHVERGSLQERREDALSWDTQDGEKRVQKRLDGAHLLVGDLYRGSEGNPRGKTARNTVGCEVSPTGPGERVGIHHELPEGERRTEAEEFLGNMPVFYGKQQHTQIIETTQPSGPTTFSRAVGSHSIESNANRITEQTAFNPVYQPPPPPISAFFPLSYSPVPTSHLDQAADMIRVARNVDAPNAMHNPLAALTSRAREVERTVFSTANLSSQAGRDQSESAPQPPTRVLPPGHAGHNSIEVAQQATVGDVSPRAGNHAKHKSERTKAGSSGSKGGAQMWTSADPETNDLTWSSAGSRGEHAKAKNIHVSNSLLSSNRLQAFSGSACEGRAGEKGRDGSASTEYPHSHIPSHLSTPDTEYAPNARIAAGSAPASQPRQSPGRDTTTGVADGFTVNSLGARAQLPRGGQDNECAEFACRQWCYTPPPTRQGSSFSGGVRYSPNETTLSSLISSDGSFALLREQQQPWLKSPMSCSSQSPCRPSHYCEQSTDTFRWSPTLASPEPSSNLSSNCCVDGGASKPELLAVSPVHTLNSKYAKRPHGRQPDFSVMGCRLPPKHLPQFGRQAASGGAPEDLHNGGNGCLNYGTATIDGAVGLPRSISGTNSGVLWGIHVPPISLLLTLPLNLPFGKIMKFGSPGVPSQTSVVLPPPPPPTELDFASTDGQQRSLCGLISDRPALMPRSLGAKKSYYYFSPTLHEGAHTLFSHAGGICDTFAASLHLELAILYVPPPLLPHVASMFQALRPRLPRFTSALRLECGGLEERNAPGRFGGKVLTVSCAIEDPQERYKFQQMQEFLMLFQSKVEVLLREYALQQQLLLGYRPTNNGQQKGAAIPGKKHNIWRYAMSCFPTSLGTRQPFTQSVPGEGIPSSENAAGSFEDLERTSGPVTQGELATGAGSTGGSASSGSGFVDLTIRAFEAKALDKGTKEYARSLAVKDVCISEIRLVTTRGIEEKTCEIDPRYPQYSIGTRPIVLAPDGQLCRHSLVDVHVLPDVWEVRLRPGNTRDEQKRLVERCMLAAIENRPLHVRNEALKAAIDAGVILWANGEIMLLPAPPALALKDGEKEQEKRQDDQQEEEEARGNRRVEAFYENGQLHQSEQATPTAERSDVKNDDWLRPRECTRTSTPTTHVQDQAEIRAAYCQSREYMSSSLAPLQGRDFFGDLLLLSSHGSSPNTPHSLQKEAQLGSDIRSEDRKAPEPATPLCRSRGSIHCYGRKIQQPAAFSPLGYDLLAATPCHSPAARSSAESVRRTQTDTLLTPFSLVGAQSEHYAGEQDRGVQVDYQARSQQHRGSTLKCLESIAAAMAAVPPGLDIHGQGAQERGTSPDALYTRPQAILQQKGAQENILSDFQIRQAQEFLQALASSWAHPQQQRQAAANAAVKELQKETETETKEADEQSVAVKKSLSGPALQHVPGALRLLQQLQHALSGNCLHSGAPTDDAGRDESPVLRTRPSSPPVRSPNSNWVMHLGAQGGSQEFQQRELMDPHPIPSCGRRIGPPDDSPINNFSATAGSAGRRMLTCDHSALMDLAKLLESENNSNVYKAAMADSFVHSRHGGSLLRVEKELDIIIPSNNNDDTTQCTGSHRSCSSGGDTCLSVGRSDRDAEEKGEQGDQGAAHRGGGDDRRSTLSYSYPSRVVGGPPGCTLQGESSSAAAHRNFGNTDVHAAATSADAACSWGARSDLAYSSAPSGLREQGTTIAFSEELSQRQQSQVSYATAHEVLDMQSPTSRQQSTGLTLSQHDRSRVAQRQQDRKSISQHHLQPQHLPQDHAHGLPQRRENVQRTAAEELLERHALELLRCGAHPSGKNICSQGFLPGDLLQQYESTASPCKELVTSGRGEGVASRLPQECGSDETTSQQRENIRYTFFDSYVEGLEQRYDYS